MLLYGFFTLSAWYSIPYTVKYKEQDSPQDQFSDSLFMEEEAHD